MCDINKSMEARHGSVGDLFPAGPSGSLGGGGALNSPFRSGGSDMETISHRLFQYRFNYSAKLTAWVWFVLTTSIKCVNT